MMFIKLISEAHEHLMKPARRGILAALNPRSRIAITVSFNAAHFEVTMF